MTETWCGSLLVVLVPLITALNGVLIYQLKSLQNSADRRRSEFSDE